MAALGMSVPDKNTPEMLVDYMRRENVRQGELAKLSTLQPLTPQQQR